ncbi:uracil-DNA glycosylase [Variovorax sp. VNK109]|uniref:uracil-DNA glycosylase n=1 Tax=Variovorax sp. VNK109 TaxID=3400919 RepID=UPI003C11C843
MPLDLDARRLAMLQEMGIRVWQAPARTAVVPAELPPVVSVIDERSATWLVVGDAPGAFDGDAGVLLDRMLLAVGRSRTGAGDEGARLAYAVSGDGGESLREEVWQARPKVILALGRHAVAALLGTAEPLGVLRGRQHEFEGIPVVASYPPQHLIRNPQNKAKAWEDLCAAMLIGVSASRTLGGPRLSSARLHGRAS